MLGGGPPVRKMELGKRHRRAWRIIAGKITNEWRDHAWWINQKQSSRHRPFRSIPSYFTRWGNASPCPKAGYKGPSRDLDGSPLRGATLQCLTSCVVEAQRSPHCPSAQGRKKSGSALSTTTPNMHPRLPLSNGSEYSFMIFSGHRVNNAVRCLKFRQMKNFRPIEFGNARRWAWPAATTSLSPPRAGHGPAPLAPSRCLHPPSRDTRHSSAVWNHLFFFFSHCLHFL